MRRLCLRCWARDGRKVPVRVITEGLCESCQDEQSQRAYESVYQPKGAR